MAFFTHTQFLIDRGKSRFKNDLSGINSIRASMIYSIASLLNIKMWSPNMVSMGPCYFVLRVNQWLPWYFEFTKHHLMNSSLFKCFPWKLRDRLPAFKCFDLKCCDQNFFSKLLFCCASQKPNAFLNSNVF